MAESTMHVSELLDKRESTDDIDFLREGVRVLAEALMDAEVTGQVGAAHGERAPDRRATQRNGYRPRRWETPSSPSLEQCMRACPPGSAHRGLTPATRLGRPDPGAPGRIRRDRSRRVRSACR